MPAASRQSAARRRCVEQLARLGALPADAPVSAVKPFGDDPARFAIHLGRVRLGPVHAADLDALDLVVGSPLDAPARLRLAGALAREAARADALALLRTRSRSKRDLLDRLALKGHDRTPAREALDRLERVGLLDDAALARDRAAVIAESGRAGPRAAEVKLRALGIDPAAASGAVGDAYAGIDTLAQATEAAHRRARTFGPDLDRPTRQRRLYGFLARRGYDHDTCRKATEAALTGLEDD